MPSRFPLELQDLVAKTRRRVLVVDDHQDTVETMTNLLKLLNQDVRAISDSSIALTIAREFMPDVAILDLEMPHVSGMELALQLRTIPGLEKISLIALTGWADQAMIQRCHEFGFNRFFAKPPPLEQIFFALSEYD